MISTRSRHAVRLAAGLLILLLLAGCAGSAGSSPTEQPAAVTQAPGAADATPTSPPAPGPDEFVNPVYRVNFPDPFILQAGDMFYAYATNGTGKNVQLAVSQDLIKWERKNDAMPALASWVRLSSSDVWAPEVLQLGEKYLLYYTARDKTSGKQCVGVAVSDSPEGKFNDRNEAPLVCQVEEGGTIDASPYQDGDQLYLLYKNDGNCCGIATYIYVQELAPDGLSLVDEPVRLVRNEKPWEGIVIEAPTMLKHADQYYLFYSANSYAGFEYAVGYATCETVLGPCQAAPENPILASVMEPPLVIGPGHQTIVQIGEQTWIVYHAWEFLASGRRGDRRMMWIDRLNWVDGKPVVDGPTTGPQQRPLP